MAMRCQYATVDRDKARPDKLGALFASVEQSAAGLVVVQAVGDEI
jgi:hypothetical protein